VPHSGENESECVEPFVEVGETRGPGSLIETRSPEWSSFGRPCGAKPSPTTTRLFWGAHCPSPMFVHNPCMQHQAI
jgi:hypothetical protein